MAWFGSLTLAWKYCLIFGSLLAATLLLGLVKVLLDRRRLKKFRQQAKDEATAKGDQVELNQREKDEGDLFGIRAIEAGYFGGVVQSRPSSAAGSVAASHTLVGSPGASSPMLPSTASPTTSIASLPLAHTTPRDSADPHLSLPSEPYGPQPRPRKAPAALKLRPSEAELSGRINHSAAVNMSLVLPPSPVLPRHHHASSSSPTSDYAPDRSPATSPTLPPPDRAPELVHSPDGLATFTLETRRASHAAELLLDADADADAAELPAPASYVAAAADTTAAPRRPSRDEARSLFPYSERTPAPPRPKA